MILFNGAALENAAPVKVEDIRVSPIALSVTARQRPIRWGAGFVRVTGESRTVSITFALMEQDATARAFYLSQITEWARTDTPGRLELPGYPGRYLECICTGLPEPSTRQWWESRLRLVFTTYDNPYWTANVEDSADCGTEFFAGGNAPPIMQLRATIQTAGNVSYSDGTDTMTFTGIGPGALVVDLNRQTAAVDGASVMDKYSFASVFLLPRAGRQTITGPGKVYYVQRWE